MTAQQHPVAAPHRGTDTRARARAAALELFTRQGYEATSLRQIAEVVGINKASLYHHFTSKEAILQSLVEERGTEAAELLAWIREQPRTPRLLEDAVLRWVDTFTSEKLAGIRFMTANPLVVRELTDRDGGRIGNSLQGIADELVALLPRRSGEDALLVRMAILSINAAVQAAANTDVADSDIVAAARRSARALVQAIGSTR